MRCFSSVPLLVLQADQPSHSSSAKRKPTTAGSTLVAGKRPASTFFSARPSPALPTRTIRRSIGGAFLFPSSLLPLPPLTLLLTASYTAQWNLLDYPGIVFPTGLQADPAVDTKPTRTSFFSDEDRFNDDLCTSLSLPLLSLRLLTTSLLDAS